MRYQNVRLGTALAAAALPPCLTSLFAVCCCVLSPPSRSQAEPGWREQCLCRLGIPTTTQSQASGYATLSHRGTASRHCQRAVGFAGTRPPSCISCCLGRAACCSSPKGPTSLCVGVMCCPCRSVRHQRPCTNPPARSSLPLCSCKAPLASRCGRSRTSSQRRISTSQHTAQAPTSSGKLAVGAVGSCWGGVGCQLRRPDIGSPAGACEQPPAVQ